MENTCLKHWPCGMLPRAFLKRLNSSQAKLENLQDIGRLTRQIDRRDVNELLLNMPECISWHHLMNDSVIGYNLSRIFTNCVYCEFRKTQARVACSQQRTQPAQIWSIIASTCAFCTFAPQKTSAFCWGETDLDRGKKRKTLPSTLPKLWIFINQAAKKKLPMSFLFNFHNWRPFFSEKKVWIPTLFNDLLGPTLKICPKPWIHFHQSPRRPQQNKRWMHWLASRTVPPIQKLFRVVYIVNKSFSLKKKTRLQNFTKHPTPLKQLSSVCKGLPTLYHLTTPKTWLLAILMSLHAGR